jgi:hypothetical protein
MGKQGMKRKKGNQSERFATPEPQPKPDHEPESSHWAAEQAGERARQQSLAAREKATRMKLSVGQTKVQRLHKGNQPRGG